MTTKTVLKNPNRRQASPRPPTKTSKPRTVSSSAAPPNPTSSSTASAPPPPAEALASVQQITTAKSSKRHPIAAEQTHPGPTSRDLTVRLRELEAELDTAHAALRALTDATCRFVGVERHEVALEPGGFLNAASETFAEDLEITQAAGTVSDVLPAATLANGLFRLHGRLQAVRTSSELIDRLLLDQQVPNLRTPSRPTRPAAQSPHENAAE